MSSVLGLQNNATTPAQPTDPTVKYYFTNAAGILCSIDSSGTVLIVGQFASVITPVAGNYTVVQDDYVVVNSATACTITLPNASTAMKPVTVKSVGVGVITVQGVSSQVIDGNANIQLTQTNAVQLVPSGGAWYIC